MNRDAPERTTRTLDTCANKLLNEPPANKEPEQVGKVLADWAQANRNLIALDIDRERHERNAAKWVLFIFAVIGIAAATGAQLIIDHDGAKAPGYAYALGCVSGGAFIVALRSWDLWRGKS